MPKSGIRTRHTRFMRPLLYPIELSLEEQESNLRLQPSEGCALPLSYLQRAIDAASPRHTPRQRRAHRPGRNTSATRTIANRRQSIAHVRLFRSTHAFGAINPHPKSLFNISVIANAGQTRKRPGSRVSRGVHGTGRSLTDPLADEVRSVDADALAWLRAAHAQTRHGASRAFVLV